MPSFDAETDLKLIIIIIYLGAARAREGGGRNRVFGWDGTEMAAAFFAVWI
jgi:hypothetical protein